MSSIYVNISYVGARWQAGDVHGHIHSGGGDPQRWTDGQPRGILDGNPVQGTSTFVDDINPLRWRVSSPRQDGEGQPQGMDRH